MRHYVLLGAALCLAVAAEAVISRAAQRKDPNEERVAELVKQFHERRFARREAAARELATLGEPILDLLRKAAADEPNLGVRRDLGRVIDTITPRARTIKTAGIDLVLIDEGEFVMGSPNLEEGRRGDEQEHRVRISRPHYMGKYEVTQDQYRELMKAGPSWFAQTGGGKEKVEREKTARYPVDNVTWYDAVEFCNRLSKAEGLEPYYRLAEVSDDKGWIDTARVTVAGGRGYRLPTEAEWERACRAGTTTPFHHGRATRAGQANFKPILIASGYGSSLQWPDLARTTTVGSHPANDNGLHDMHGNVAEWCGDWYERTYYANSPANDPKGPNQGTHRVLRGGSWMVTEASCRSAARFMQLPGERTFFAGFRVCRTP